MPSCPSHLLTGGGPLGDGISVQAGGHVSVLDCGASGLAVSFGSTGIYTSGVMVFAELESLLAPCQASGTRFLR